MAKSTAPILIIGAITIADKTLQLVELNHFPASTAISFQWRTIAATGLAAGAFALLERVNQPLTVGVAWVALVSTLLVGLSSDRAPFISQLEYARKHPEKFIFRKED